MQVKEIGTGKQKIVQGATFSPNDQLSIETLKNEIRGRALRTIAHQVADGRSYYVRLGEAEYLKGGVGVLKADRSKAQPEVQSERNPQIVVHFEVSLIDPDQAGIGEFVSELAIPPQALAQAKACGKFTIDDEYVFELTLEDRGWKRTA